MAFVEDLRRRSPLLAVAVAGSPPKTDRRTQIPEITSARWTEKLPPLARPGKISRDDYLQFIKRTYQRGRDAALRTAGGPENPYQYVSARSEAFFSLAEKDPARAELAMKFVHGDYAYRTQGQGAAKQSGFALFMQAVEACRWLEANPALQAADREFLTRWLLLLEAKHGTFERGAMNRSVGSAVGREFLARRLPDDPQTPQRRRYAQAVWNDWWPQRDTDENSSGYNALWLHEIDVWLEITGQQGLYQDPGLKGLAQRLAGPGHAAGRGPRLRRRRQLVRRSGPMDRPAGDAGPPSTTTGVSSGPPTGSSNTSWPTKTRCGNGATSTTPPPRN